MKAIFILFSALSLAYGFDLEEHGTIRQTNVAATHLDIDNVNGTVHVTGYNGTEMQMVIEKTIKAKSQERMEAAKREVKLDVSSDADTLRAEVSGPNHHHGDGRSGYQVRYDFEVRVPVAAILKLSNVNGSIRVENTSGNFDLSGVNGKIELNDTAGSGTAHTVNGKIEASFARNPSSDCSFKTVNGNIEVSFLASLSANVRVKTFNGGAYTDFEAAALPMSNASAQRRNGMFVYRAERSTSMRIGTGGPELRFETLNGSIKLLKRGQ